MNKILSYKFQKKDREDKKVFSHIFPNLQRNNKYDDYINYNGLKVYPLFRLYLLGECEIQINWIKSRQDIPQGIDASVHNAKLRILDGSNKETKAGFAFNYSGWPSGKVSLLCIPVKFHKEEKQQQERWLSIYNIWEKKRSDGRMERCSWGGNYGVVIVRKEENVYRLNFSCGEVDHPNVTFDDLVVDVAIKGEYVCRFQCSKL